MTRHQRAHLSGRVQGIAHAQAADSFHQPLQKRLLDRGVHEHASRVRTHRARGIKIREQRAAHGVVQVGVVEHDQRRFAAQFERHVLERLRGVAHHGLAGAHLARE